MTGDMAEAKRRLPLPALLQRLGLDEHAKKSAQCPCHDDKHNSFSVWQNNGAWFWKCHAGCGGGDEINFIETRPKNLASQRSKVVSRNRGHGRRCRNRPAIQKDRGDFDWAACVDAFTENYLERLADWRGYSGAFGSWLHKRGLVGMCQKCIAFPVHDRTGIVVAAHYRQKDGSWRYYPQGTKVSPLVIGELIAGEPVHVFESPWDCLAFMDTSGERSGVIITRGASNGALAASLIPETSTVYVWTQNDPAGEKWQNTIYANTKAAVKQAKIPAQHKDLNDWTRAGATVDDLLAAMLNAKVVRAFEGVAVRQAGKS